MRLYTKRERGQFTSSTFPRYRQTPILLKRVNAHAKWRELLLLFLQYFEILPISGNKNLKADIHPICPFQLYISSAHRHFGFKDYTL